jgi:hypothetical protein
MAGNLRHRRANPDRGLSRSAPGTAGAPASRFGPRFTQSIPQGDAHGGR